MSIKVHAKTISDVHNQLVKEKVLRNMRSQRFFVGSVSFFYGLFDLMAGPSYYDYRNRETKTDIRQSKESRLSLS